MATVSEYYHHGKGIESWLRSVGSATAESGRDFHGEFERVQRDALQDFEAAVHQLESTVKDEAQPGTDNADHAE